MAKPRKPQPSNVLRGYGRDHKRERALWEKRIAAGGVTCARPDCGRPIVPGMLWDLDHTDDRSGYLGPSHRHCNRKAGAVKGNRQRRQRRGATGSPLAARSSVPDPTPANMVERWSRHWAGPLNPRCPRCRELGHACTDAEAA
jgi:hypothetical protein